MTMPTMTLLDKLKIDPELRELNKCFKKHGFSLRFVGGVVRDLLNNKTPNDIDLCTDATPDEQIKIYDTYDYHYIPTGLKHGTVTVVINNVPYEITSLRTEKNHDGRHADVDFTRDWEEDLSRRDLTINAMSLTFDGELIDPYGGKEDLVNNKVKFVGKPDARIKEDYLRILRYIRFWQRYGYTIDDATCDAIIRNVKGLETISGERIWQELQKIVTNKKAGEALSLIYSLDIAPYISLPNYSENRVHAINKFCTKIKSPITAIAYLIDNTNDGEIIDSHWKLSIPEYKLLSFLIKNKYKTFTDDAMYDFIVDKVPSLWVHELCILQNKITLANKIMQWTPKMFPVTGNDLQKMGYNQGVEMGEILRNLKDDWKKSRYTLTKEELLSSYELHDTIVTEAKIINPTYDLKGKYLEFNKKYFDNILPTQLDVVFRKVPGYLTGMFYCYYRVKPQSEELYKKLKKHKQPFNATSNNSDLNVSKSYIAIDNKLSFTDEQYDGILLHEMIHVWEYVAAMKNTLHGEHFMKKLKEVEAKSGITIPTSENIFTPQGTNIVDKRIIVLILHTVQYEGHVCLIYSPQTYKKNESILKDGYEKIVDQGRVFDDIKIYDLTDNQMWTTKSSRMRVQRLTNPKFYDVTDAELTEIENNGKLLWSYTFKDTKE